MRGGQRNFSGRWPLGTGDANQPKEVDRTCRQTPIRGEIFRLAHAGLDRHGFARAAIRVLRRAVPFDGAAVVWFDPATSLPVDSWIDDSLTEIDLDEADVDQFRQLAASGRRAASVSKTNGGTRELRAVCVSESGMWGAIALHRERGAGHFTVRDVNLLASLSGGFADVQRLRLEGDPRRTPATAIPACCSSARTASSWPTTPRLSGSTSWVTPRRGCRSS